MFISICNNSDYAVIYVQYVNGDFKEDYDQKIETCFSQV